MNSDCLNQIIEWFGDWLVKQRSRADSVPSNSRSRTSSENAMVTPPGSNPTGHGHMDMVESARPSSIYLPEGSFSPVVSMTSPHHDSMASSLSADDLETHLALQMTDGYMSSTNSGRNRFSHTATPENSLPKESTILEEERSLDSTEDYLSMRFGQLEASDVAHPHVGGKTGRPALSSSPSARSFHSSSLGRSVSLSSNRAAKTRTPPIKPPLHHNPYMEMTSPVQTTSWSPPNATPAGYMPMLPGTYSFSLSLSLRIVFCPCFKLFMRGWRSWSCRIGIKYWFRYQ